jgi:hypothetical protein
MTSFNPADTALTRKDTGLFGSVIAPEASASGGPLSFTDPSAPGRRILAFVGTDGPGDNFTLPNHSSVLANVVVSRGIDDGIQSNRATENVQGTSSKYDVVVLPGRREDYQVVMPGVKDYPGQGSSLWKGQNSLYGGVVILRHMNGDELTLSGVDRVVFDHNNAGSQNPVQMMTQMGQMLKSGQMSSVPMRELFATARADLTSEQQRQAQVAATPEAAARLETVLSKHSITPQGLERAQAQVMKDLAGLPVQDRAYKPDVAEESIAKQALFDTTPIAGPSR